MKLFGKEFWIGFLAISAALILLFFSWFLGVFRSVSGADKIFVLYDFAGGVETGSPVRVAGVKVGRVDKVEFLNDAERKSLGTALRVSITVDREARFSLKDDSKFYINMAGIIGERYLEISPGSNNSKELSDRSTVRGVDPPRIDQLISQGYGVFGKIADFLKKNESNVTELLDALSELMTEANQLFKSKERKKLVVLLDNLVQLTAGAKDITAGLLSEEAKRVYEKAKLIIERASEVDKKEIKKFLQEEGVKARIF